MEVKVQKWGNSNGIRIPKEVMEELSIKTDDILSMIREDNKIIITKKPKKQTLREMFENYDGPNLALVLSSNDFNKYTKIVMALPISSNTKMFPTHYILRDTKKIKGAVLCEHIRSIDYTERKIKFVEKASKDDLEYSQVLFNLCLE